MALKISLWGNPPQNELAWDLNVQCGYGDFERVLVRGNLGLILKGLPFEIKLRTRTALGHFFLLVYIGQIFCFEAFFLFFGFCIIMCWDQSVVPKCVRLANWIVGGKELLTLNGLNVCRRLNQGVASNTSSAQSSRVVTRTLHPGKLLTCGRGQTVTFLSVCYPFRFPRKLFELESVHSVTAGGSPLKTLSLMSCKSVFSGEKLMISLGSLADQ